MNIFFYLKDRLTGKAPKGAKRSSQWRKVRNEYKSKNPRCAICGLKTKVEVHHKFPFHLFPDLELDPNNLISLCENKKYGSNCHLLFGHLGNYKNFNDDIEIDAFTWRKKLLSFKDKK